VSWKILRKVSRGDFSSSEVWTPSSLIVWEAVDWSAKSRIESSVSGMAPENWSVLCFHFNRGWEKYHRKLKKSLASPSASSYSASCYELSAKAVPKNRLMEISVLLRLVN
jgi:hypothetical protein